MILSLINIIYIDRMNWFYTDIFKRSFSKQPEIIFYLYIWKTYLYVSLCYHPYYVYDAGVCTSIFDSRMKEVDNILQFIPISDTMNSPNRSCFYLPTVILMPHTFRVFFHTMDCLVYDFRRLLILLFGMFKINK